MRRPPRARPVAGSLGTARMAECQPSTRSERAASAFGQASAFLFQRGDPAATRRFGGNAEVPASASRARQEGPVPCTARSGRFRPVPHGPFQGPFRQSLRIFFLKFQHFIFRFSLCPARSTPPASLRSAAPSRRGPAGQRTPPAPRPARPLVLPRPARSTPPASLRSAAPLSEGAGRAADGRGSRGHGGRPLCGRPAPSEGAERKKKEARPCGRASRSRFPAGRAT